jgi:hypothetical protein
MLVGKEIENGVFLKGFSSCNWVDEPGTEATHLVNRGNCIGEDDSLVEPKRTSLNRKQSLGSAIESR